jgi:hypothetical protein
LDPNESSATVSQPRVDPNVNLAMIRILNPNADPYGPDFIPMIITNMDMSLTTNYVLAPGPTNVTFNFGKSNYRVPEDVNDPSVSPWTQVTLWVERFGTKSRLFIIPCSPARIMLFPIPPRSESFAEPTRIFT